MTATPLRMPREIEVQQKSGEPAIVIRNGVRKKITAIRNVWRIDDEWWREQISRLYFQVELLDGPVMDIFEDLTSGKWYQQRY